MGSGLILEAWFLHEELVLKLLGRQEARQLTRELPPHGTPFAELHSRHAFEEALAERLQVLDVKSLAVTRLDASTVVGDLVWLEQAFYFKGLGSARSGDGGRASFSGKLDVDPSLTVTGEYNAQRVRGETAVDQLSGRSRQFIVGYVLESGATRVRLRPLFIGQRLVTVANSEYPMDVRDAAHVWPRYVDQFKGVDFDSKLTRKDLNVLKDAPEEQIKHWFAEIIGEPAVPKDWGGEQFDLWTRMLSIAGEPARAAVAFKGPAVFRPMKIADLGKNGDQIDRLAATAADLLVVQHCHEITAPVENMLRAYALMPGRTRRYMTINGYDTIRIIRHYGYLS